MKRSISQIEQRRATVIKAEIKDLVLRVHTKLKTNRQDPGPKGHRVKPDSPKWATEALPPGLRDHNGGARSEIQLWFLSRVRHSRWRVRDQ